MNYYPFHIGDYLSATRHLSWDEDAAYRRLLDAYYTSEKPLPADERRVFRLVVASTEEQREAVRIVLQEFFKLTEEGWVNERADREIDAMRDKQQKQRDKANKRWHKPEQEHGIASAMPWHEIDDAAALIKDADAMPPTPTPTPTPIIKEQQPSSDKSDTPANFAELWKAYPKKVGKAETLKAWKAMKINGEFPQIMEALERQKLSKKWQEGFILDPVRWVKGRRWEDVVEVEPDFTSLLSDQITPIDCGDNWKDSASGITVKGRSLGIEQNPGEPFPMFKIRVIEASQ